MKTVSRELREHVVHALAIVGVVWSMALLAVLFMTTAAHGEEAAAGTERGSTGAGHELLNLDTYTGSPSTAGLVLVLVLVAAGVVVLAFGTAPAPTDATADRYVGLADSPPADLSFAFTHGGGTEG